MGKFFYLPPNAKIVKWTKNSNAKSTNLTLESTKSQWQTPPWLVEWLGSPPWLSSLKYYYCEQDYGQICHMNVGKTMNLAKEGNVYICYLIKRKLWHDC
jgi:hypothetical protein